MIQNALKKIFGTKNEREIKRMLPVVAAINALEPEMQALDDAALAGLTPQYREEIEQRVAAGEDLEDVLVALLPRAFATVREAARRTLGMRHYDVQLIGGMVLHEGRIAEMKTGEGKTLVATLPLYLNALTGKGAHLITVNDYLARRDAEWMGKIYRFLGMRTGVIVHDLSNAERKEAYESDITYGTNNEFGFDYLRDNMKYDLAEYVQRDLFYAIVDEVDSILIDEARTPLIISGATEDNPQRYQEIDRYVRDLIEAERALGTDPTANPKDGQNPGRYFHIDLEHRSVSMTEDGVELAEKLCGVSNLFAPDEIETLHHVQQALRAHTLYQRDVEYIVENGEVVIIDEFTGRKMSGRRWSDGLHQAVEAKEGVRIESENQTLATITFQNFFKMYDKLAGMTGTAETEAGEFHSIYALDVVAIPTNRPIARVDEADLVFKRESEKFKAIATTVKELHEKGAPVLVGTTSVEKSERIAAALNRQGVRKEAIAILNAKQHEREAEIVAQAGRSGAITIATNMAGRGTDIVLGGNPEHKAWRMLEERGFERADLEADQFIKAALGGDVERARAMIAADERLDEGILEILGDHQVACKEDQQKVLAAGGLHIVGTERHESRRVDNQLRGRAGRQGDAGWSQFYLSLEDDLIKVFGGERILNMMDRLGMQEDDAIQHPWLSKSIESAQQKVEARNFDIRKNLLEYDNVMNQQRTVVYKERRRILAGEQLSDLHTEMAEDLAVSLVEEAAPPRTHAEDWDWDGLQEAMRGLGFDWQAPEDDVRGDFSDESLLEEITAVMVGAVREKQERYGQELFDQVLRFVMLQTLDQLWKDHLLAMDHLKQSVGLRGYGQKDPKREYAKEGFELFRQMLGLLREDIVRKVSRVELRTPEEQARAAQLEERLRQQPAASRMTLQHADPSGGDRPSTVPPPPPPPPTGGIVAGPRAARPPMPAPAKPVSPAAPGGPKPGRNDPCPCGSGKKYKKCHYPQYG